MGAGGVGHLAAEGGVIQQAQGGVGHPGGVVVHEKAVYAVADGLGAPPALTTTQGVPQAIASPTARP